MTDQVDALELLLEDHARLVAIAERLDGCDDPDDAAALVRLFVDELTRHEAVERELVFPTFRDAFDDGDADESVERRLGEHEELDDVVAEMLALTPETYGFVKRASALLCDVRGHFAREEESVFLRMRDGMTTEELAALGERIVALREQDAARAGFAVS